MSQVIAVCLLRSESQVNGSVKFSQSCLGGPVTIKMSLSGLSPGKHGLHIHEFGDVSGGCQYSGGHFNPTGSDHGDPGEDNGHVGDLGNIEADSEGKLSTELINKKISIVGPQSIIGRSLMVDENEDDFGHGGHETSTITGNCGAHVAYGVIGIGK